MVIGDIVLDRYQRILKKYVKNEQRLKHCVSSAQYMRRYADKFFINKDNAYIAGLFHDVAKELTNTEIVSLAEAYNKRGIDEIRNFEFKKKFPSILHGAASAEILINELSIEDADVLSAVSHHTYGGRDLSPLAKYTYVFDYCEPLRTYRGSKKVYKVLTKKYDLDKAYYMSYRYILLNVIKRKRPVSIDSIEGYNEAYNILKRRDDFR